MCKYTFFSIDTEQNFIKNIIVKSVYIHKKGDFGMIVRTKYLNELIKAKNNGFPKIITGIRRCGKSFLLNTIYKNYLLNNGVKKKI